MREAVAARIAEMLSLATNSFNGGPRAYFFALPALRWVFHPLLFVVLTAWVVPVPLRRPLWSRAVGAVRGYIEAVAARRDG